MEKFKNANRGITLVALVITIIILLILAGISISSLTGSGLFQKAEDARTEYREAENRENSILGEYENHINNLGNNLSDGDKIVHFSIDGVEYSCEKGKRWKDFVDYEAYGGDEVVAYLDTSHFGGEHDENQKIYWIDWSTFEGGAISMVAYFVKLDGEYIYSNSEIVSGKYIISDEVTSIYNYGNCYIKF